MSLLVNGKNYDWGDTRVEAFPGLDKFITSISYGDEQPSEPTYGKGRLPLGYTQGAYKGSGSIEMFREGFNIVAQIALAFGNNIYGLKPFPIIVSYADDDMPTTIDTLPKCKFVKNNLADLKSGSSDPAKVKLDFVILGPLTPAGV